MALQKKNDNFDYKEFYYDTLENLIHAEYEKVSENLSFLRTEEFSKSATAEHVRRFLTARLSLKQGESIIETQWLELPVCKDSWIEAEKFFVLGTIAYQENHIETANEFFQKASEKFYNMKMFSRALLATFNGFICDLEKFNHSLDWQLEALRKMQQAAELYIEDKGCRRILALIHRQRAHALEDSGKLLAALQEAARASEIFGLHGPKSDYHLALVHAADIALDLHDDFKARTFVDYIIAPIDKRVEFPLAVVKWRLGENIPDSKNFKVIPQNWIKKLEQLQSANKSSQEESLVWNISDFSFRSESASLGLLKPSSMEGQLILLLLQKNATKNLMIEVLWPEQSKFENLSNRFHRLLNRINTKFPSLIAFDGKAYRLDKPIRIIR